MSDFASDARTVEVPWRMMKYKDMRPGTFIVSQSFAWYVISVEDAGIGIAGRPIVSTHLIDVADGGLSDPRYAYPWERITTQTFPADGENRVFVPGLFSDKAHVYRQRPWLYTDPSDIMFFYGVLYEQRRRHEQES